MSGPAEPLLANPVAFAFDEKGRAFVVETYRAPHVGPGIRKNMDWLLDSLAMRTVEIASLSPQGVRTRAEFSNRRKTTRISMATAASTGTTGR